MKLTRQYATALIESTKSTSVESALVQLKATLKKRGHTRLFRSILETAVALSQVKRNQVEYRVAKKEDASRYVAHLFDHGINIPEETAVVDDSLVGGFFYRDGRRLIDGSYKRALINLYTKITQ